MSTPWRTAHEALDHLLPEALAREPERARAIGGTFHVRVRGAGDWTVDLDRPSCSRGAPPSPSTTVEIAATDFEAALANPALITALYFSGKLTVTGDLSRVPKLLSLLKT